MRIQSLNRITQAYQVQKQNKVDRVDNTKRDEVRVSDKARDYQYAYKLAMQEPAVREDKVAALKDSIESGTYTKSAEEVSKKILGQLDIRG